MKSQGIFVALALLVAPVLVHASCDAVKASIDAKLKAKGLEGYTLAVVPQDAPVTTGSVVGQCEGDKQIVYTKGTSSAGQAKGGEAPAHHPAESSSSGSPAG